MSLAVATKTSADPADPDYRTSLPSEDHVRELLAYAVELWRPRNEFFARVRRMLEGKNPIEGPPAAQYAVKVVHTHLLQKATAEKSARFMKLPLIQCVAEGAGTPARHESTQVENWLNTVQYRMELQGDGDVWSRMQAEAILFDMAVERIECAPSPSWPELTLVMDDNGAEREKLSFYQPFNSTDEYETYREEYKKHCPHVPFRSVHVMPENYLPVREGVTTVETFELERRSLREVLTNSNFETTKLRNMIGLLGLNGVELLRRQVVIAHYVNLNWHAYFALMPGVGTNGTSATWPDARNADNLSIGQPVFLHAYQHGLGRVIYNEMGGRNGGWKTGVNEIETVMNACLEINQNADEVMSQVATNVRNVYWPNLVAYYDPELRDQTDAPPKAPNLKEGANVGMWKGEDLKSVFQPIDNPVLKWYFDHLLKQFEGLTGSGAVYGQSAPGVDTGFHQNLQVTQSEHLDDKLETAFSTAAVNRAMIILAYVKRLDEKVWANFRLTNDDGQRIGTYIAVDPKKLKVMPQLDAQVRKPRAIDFTAAIRAALDASADRHGPGTPLLDDDTILERILGEAQPDIIERKKLIQNEKRKLVDSGVISKRIAERLSFILAEKAEAQVTPDMVAGADPALLEVLKRQNVNTTVAADGGGVDPALLQAQMLGGQEAGVPMLNDPTQPPPGGPSPMNVAPGPMVPPVSEGMGPNSPRLGQGGGTPPGTPQPEAVLGKMLASGAFGRR